MKKRKSLLAFLLIIAMLLPLFGCGEKSDTATENYSYLKELKEEYVLTATPFEYEQLIPPYTFSASRGVSWLEQYLGSLGITEQNEPKKSTSKTETLTYSVDDVVSAVKQHETRVYSYMDKRDQPTEILIYTDFDPSVYSNPEKITFEFQGNTSDGIAAATRFIENFSDVRLAADFSNNNMISKTYYITKTSYYTLIGSITDSTNIDSSIVKVSLEYHGDVSTRVYKKDNNYIGDVVTGDVTMITGIYEPIPLSGMKLFGKISKAQLLNYLQDQGVGATSMTITSHYINTGDAMSMQNSISFDQSATTNFLTITEAYSYNPKSIDKEINETFNVYFKQKPSLPEQRDLIALLFSITESEAARIVEQGTAKVVITSGTSTGTPVTTPTEASSAEELASESSGEETEGEETTESETTGEETNPDETIDIPDVLLNGEDEYQAIFDTIRMCFEIIRPVDKAEATESEDSTDSTDASTETESSEADTGTE